MSLDAVGVYNVTFTGHNGTGAISVSGVKAGDIIVSIIDPNSGTPQTNYAGNSFYVKVVTDGQIYQTSGSDWSAMDFSAVLVRPL